MFLGNISYWGSAVVSLKKKWEDAQGQDVNVVFGGGFYYLFKCDGHV